jgi:ElaB/YqjD/DUF883 family membrane-anchored ribosome-binding protein
MSNKPKNFSDAIEQLEKHMDNGGDLRMKVEHEIKRLNEQLETLKDKFGDEAVKAKKQVEQQVQENPWAALGVVGLVFLIIGFLLGTRRSR